MSNNLSRRQILKMTASFLAGASAALLPSYVTAQSDVRNNYPVVRKNIKYLRPQEKAAFVNAIKTLKNTIPEGSKVSIYDQFVAMHIGSMGLGSMVRQTTRPVGPATGADAAHGNAAFLPWHREYIRRFEKALQSVDATVTLPYWDWTDPKAFDVIFQPDFLGPNGTGVTINIPGRGNFEGGPVQSGPFSQASGWVLNKDLHIDQIKTESLGTSLLRFSLLPPSDEYPIPKEDQDRVLALDDYLSFRSSLEGEFRVDSEGNLIPFRVVDNQGRTVPAYFMHNYVHGVVGGGTVDFTTVPPTPNPLGTLSNVLSSPNEPAFWLLHANVDRLWAEWQENGHEGNDFYPSEGQPYGHNLNDRMWPWDGGQSTPGNIGPGDLLSLLPVFAPDDIVTPAEVLDFRELGYRYDTNSSNHRRLWRPKVH